MLGHLHTCVARNEPRDSIHESKMVAESVKGGSFRTLAANQTQQKG
jgi:hypothetical protein